MYRRPIVVSAQTTPLSSPPASPRRIRDSPEGVEELQAVASTAIGESESVVAREQRWEQQVMEAKQLRRKGPRCTRCARAKRACGPKGPNPEQCDWMLKDQKEFGKEKDG